MKNIFTWIPRVMAILFIGFISLFALDSFTGENPLMEEMGGFFIHLIPSFILIGCLIVAWNDRVLGGALFIVVGLVFTIYFGTFREISQFFLISLPPITIGILFLFSKLSLGK